MDNFKKIEYEDIVDGKVEKKLTESVKDEIDVLMGQYNWHLYNCLIDCESPIEQLMALELDRVRHRLDSWLSNIEIFDILYQEKKELNGKNYRFDFLINIEFKILGKYGNSVNLVIECDGHDFHQKTKEQVKRDYEKDRNLQMAGYYIFRFSGSEIYNNLQMCGQRITEFIMKKYYEFEESMLKKNV